MRFLYIKKDFYIPDVFSMNEGGMDSNRDNNFGSCYCPKNCEQKTRTGCKICHNIICFHNADGGLRLCANKF